VIAARTCSRPRSSTVTRSTGSSIGGCAGAAPANTVASAIDTANLRTVPPDREV